MRRPLITIVTPSYNQGQFIEHTILSVLNQTYENLQYILVDGGSTDATMDIVNRYSSRIDIVINEKDKGQADAINKGFKLAQGELVGWINSDDLLYPECVEEIVRLYLTTSNGCIFYCSAMDKIDADNNILETIHVNITDRYHLQNVDYSINQPGSFYSTETLKKVNYLNEKIHYCMDLDLWLRLLKYGSIYSIQNKSYSAFRIWPGTKTSTGGQDFLKNIRHVLLKNDANFFSRTIVKNYWYSFKTLIKSIVLELV